MSNPFELGKDAVEMTEAAYDFGFKVGSEHNRQADAHHQDVMNDNAVREQALAQETADFDPPDVSDY